MRRTKFGYIKVWSADKTHENIKHQPNGTRRLSRRIGIYGGSFDPVHLGHLWIAEAAREQLLLDEVRWIPAATSPLKRGGPIASDDDRLQMVRLAISGNSHFTVDDRELKRGDVSFTVDTVAELQAEIAADKWFLIIGSDSLASFDRWHEPARLLSMVTLAVIQRGGDPPIDFSVVEPLEASSMENRSTDRHQVVAMPVIEVSSTDLRNRIASGRSIRYQTPAPVEAMLRASGLYSDGKNAAS